MPSSVRLHMDDGTGGSKGSALKRATCDCHATWRKQGAHLRSMTRPWSVTHSSIRSMPSVWSQPGCAKEMFHAKQVPTDGRVPLLLTPASEALPTYSGRDPAASTWHGAGAVGGVSSSKRPACMARGSALLVARNSRGPIASILATFTEGLKATRAAAQWHTALTLYGNQLRQQHQRSETTRYSAARRHGWSRPQVTRLERQKFCQHLSSRGLPEAAAGL